ncbi:hypothetical protein SAMN02910382_03799 [Butyrivibrio sp. TB]|nr:hypothetical protein SAMN02910382_03799 [Butyrivibrio sp. TB]
MGMDFSCVQKSPVANRILVALGKITVGRLRISLSVRVVVTPLP